MRAGARAVAPPLATMSCSGGVLHLCHVVKKACIYLHVSTKRALEYEY